MIYGHGDDLYQYDKIHINFSSNVKPGGMDRGLKKHLENSVSDCSSYPEPRAKELELCIEQAYHLPPGSALVTNGAVEAFYLLAAWKQGCNSLIYYPSFSEYEDACHRYNHKLEFVSNTELQDKVVYGQHLVWLCNPNNPDGKIFRPDTLQAVVEYNKGTLFVIDEAYIDFVEEDVSMIKWLSAYKNLIIIRSLTKRFVIPGLRLGYLLAAPDIVAQLEKLIIPWRINILAQKAGMYCLKEGCKDGFDLATILKESKRLQNEINKVDGFSVVFSDTTFFLVKSRWKASEVKSKLIDKYGILIRDASNFRGLTDEHFRVACQTPSQNNELIKAFRKWR
ncbi:pyridoxal phosphate-dependent aminotransferase [Saccharicrinis fermentans]|uniref:Aminotransferase n=1 Tax=Saccharicrinis fermentans DSM 9555 = JCM 21142 TaxID=869213 RepID=W7XVG8_9BACT|nr:aminotransferase class I/II-fold pyridoxal phosphate-dependent enzyme [Saccharicrinis fermentans]GAF02085.1 threonine-phosphate decarboxylase [Saccharicrinis fermentans DSM 9555 = JCM 21142]